MTTPTDTAPATPQAPPANSASPSSGGELTKAVVQIENGALAPRDLEGLWRIATMVCKAGMAPAGTDSPERALIALSAGIEVGLSPMQALQNVYVINNRPALFGDAPLALVRASGLLEHFEETFEGTDDNLTAICRIKRRGESGYVTSSFSVQDAQRAGLWEKKGPWQTYPQRMLRMRARGFALRDGFPDVLRGLGIGEELADVARDKGETTASEPFVDAAAPSASSPAADQAPRTDSASSPPSDTPADQPQAQSAAGQGETAATCGDWRAQLAESDSPAKPGWFIHQAIGTLIEAKRAVGADDPDAAAARELESAIRMIGANVQRPLSLDNAKRLAKRCANFDPETGEVIPF